MIFAICQGGNPANNMCCEMLIYIHFLMIWWNRGTTSGFYSLGILHPRPEAKVTHELARRDNGMQAQHRYSEYIFQDNFSLCPYLRRRCPTCFLVLKCLLYYAKKLGVISTTKKLRCFVQPSIYAYILDQSWIYDGHIPVYVDRLS